MYRDGQLRDISEVSEMGVTIIQQFRHLGPFTHPLSSSLSVDHGCIDPGPLLLVKTCPVCVSPFGAVSLLAQGNLLQLGYVVLQSGGTDF